MSARRLTAIVAVLGLAGGCGGAAERSSGTRIDGHGLSVELPSGWDGRAYGGDPPHAPMLKLGNFRLPQDAFENLTTRSLGPGRVLVTVLDYGPPLPGWRRAPASLPLAIGRDELVACGNGGCLEGIPAGHTLAREAVVIDGRAVELIVDFGGVPSDDLLVDVNGVLRTLAVRPR